ncbi:MAG TPA: PilN domain-containing protein [Phycisphaerae bacterium]|nr:PilN domain-containing protein [Phycisphaerae bacterium]
MSINLLPPRHRLRRARDRAARRWILAGSAESLLLIAAAVGLHAFASIDDRSVHARILSIQNELSDIDARKSERAAVIARVQSQLQLRDTVNAPPNYSRLLAAVADSLADQGMLTSLKCDLTPAPMKTTAVLDANGKPIKLDPYAAGVRLQLQLSGLVRSNDAITQVVTRLQHTGLFDEVRLIKSGRDGFLGADAFTFQITCTTAGAPVGAAEGAAP